MSDSERSAAIHLEHKISPESIRLAQAHSEKEVEQGTLIEKRGKAIQAEGNSAAQLGKSIEEHGQAMKQHIAKAKELGEKLEETKSTEIFNAVVSEHVSAIQEHVEATKEFLQVSKSNPISE